MTPAAAIAGLVGWLVLGSALPVLAHGLLLESRAAARQTVTAAPRIDLRFNSRIEPAFADVRLAGPSGEAIRLHAVVSEATGPDRLTAPLPPLEPGLYTVHWRVFTVDGHISHGSFSFRIGEPPRGTGGAAWQRTWPRGDAS